MVFPLIIVAIAIVAVHPGRWRAGVRRRNSEPGRDCWLYSHQRDTTSRPLEMHSQILRAIALKGSGLDDFLQRKWTFFAVCWAICFPFSDVSGDPWYFSLAESWSVWTPPRSCHR